VRVCECLWHTRPFAIPNVILHSCFRTRKNTWHVAFFMLHTNVFSQSDFWVLYVGSDIFPTTLDRPLLQPFFDKRKDGGCSLVSRLRLRRSWRCSRKRFSSRRVRSEPQLCTIAFQSLVFLTGQSSILWMRRVCIEKKKSVLCHRLAYQCA
jgi:hypothetical protein